MTQGMGDAHTPLDAHIDGGGARPHHGVELMGWGQRHFPKPVPGVGPTTGTTGQIELAHEALDRLDIAPGPLSLRVLELTGRRSLKRRGG